MKKILHSLIIFLMALGLSFTVIACSDDGDKTTSTGTTSADPMADYTSEEITVDGVTTKAWKLDQFISKEDANKFLNITDDYDGRKLFAYNTVGSDGWTHRDNNKAYFPDLRWDEYITGYLLPKEMDAKVYFPSEDIAKTYDVKNAETVKLYLKLDFKRSDGTIVTVEPKSFTLSDVSYYNKDGSDESTDKAIKLVDMLSSYITQDTPNQYKLYAVDDYDKTCSKIEINGDGSASTVSSSGNAIAYYLPGSEGSEPKIIFLKYADVESDGAPYELQKDSNLKSFKWPVTVELDVSNGDDTATAPEYADTADLTVTYPEQ